MIGAAAQLVGALEARAFECIDTPVTGRTHGMHAEPTTFGAKFSLWALQAGRDLERLRRARERVAVGKLSGAVGTYSNIDPRVESHVCRALGLTPVPATQVVARDRHAEYLYVCAAVGTTVESIATEVRHLARSELGEVEEPFAPGQKGSSAMPHKRNPILSERLSGLARVLRGYLSAGLEDVALWHERDISHSSVERVVLPDASMLTLYMLQKVTGLVEGLVVHPERALATLLEGSHGLVFSQSVLLALVRGGIDRDAAYRIVQRDARAAWEEGRSFREVLDSDPEVTLPPAVARRGVRPVPYAAPCPPVHRRIGGARPMTSSISDPLALIQSGKVRELYDAGGSCLLMVASDRISAFDVIMAEPIPEKGRVLTAMSDYWLEALSDLAPNHLISADVANFPAAAALLPGGLEWLAGRSMLVRRAEMLDIECIVRGYLAGSAYKEYEREGTVHGMPMPKGLRHADRLPEPIFTPSTKATEGHDLNIGMEEAAELVGKEAADAAAELCLAAYRRAAVRAEEQGIVICDTKFELGYIDGALSLCDEVLTPDSSRFWPADNCAPGTNPPSFDKQPLRDWLEASRWEKKPPPPPLPDDIVSETSSRYVEAYERICGRKLSDWYGRGR